MRFMIALVVLYLVGVIDAQVAWIAFQCFIFRITNRCFFMVMKEVERKYRCQHAEEQYASSCLIHQTIHTAKIVIFS